VESFAYNERLWLRIEKEIRLAVGLKSVAAESLRPSLKASACRRQFVHA
jgi:hypothetical protein